MALITAMMAILIMLAIGAGATLNTMTETTIAANHRDAAQMLYAAEAGIALAISRLRTIDDWSTAAADPAGTTLAWGPLTDLLQVATVDPRLTVAVSVFPDPDGQQDVVIVRSTAAGAGGSRRAIQVTLRRAPAAPDGATARRIETLSWRER